MCEPRNRDNGASDVWDLTAYCMHIYPVTAKYQLAMTRAISRKSPLGRLYVKMWPLPESMVPLVPGGGGGGGALLSTG